MIGLILALSLSENEFHPVIGNTRFEGGLGGHCAKLCGKFALIASDYFRAAMGNDRSRHALLSAPRQLRVNRCMADEMFSALANERAGQGCAVADVNLHAIERCRPIVDEDEIWRIKNPRTARAYLVSNSRSQNRMFNWERLEQDVKDLRQRTLFDEMSFFDGTKL